MARRPYGSEISQSEARTRLAEGGRQLAGWTAAGAEQARALVAAALHGDRRELERLTAKLGHQHPRVAALTGRIEARTSMLPGLAAYAARAKRVTEPADPDRWVVHGHLSDHRGQPVRGATVALFDAKGAPVERFGLADTDETGYFRLAVAGVVAPDQPRESRQPGAVQVGVLEAGKAVTLDAEAMIPEAGRVEYRELRLTRGATPTKTGRATGAATSRRRAR